MRTLLIDADTLIYEAARANEYELEWEHDIWTLHAEFAPAVKQFKDDVRVIQEALEAEAVVLALSDYTKPWRREVLPTYKSNRKAVRKPVIYAQLREFVHDTYESFQREGLEGDDCLGILLTNPTLIKGEKVVVSIDKDMKTLPGLHVNLKRAREKGEWTPFSITVAEADYNHLKQALMGDTTDGYSGCPGVGEVGATKLLDPFIDHEYENLEETTFDRKGAWDTIVARYYKAGFGPEMALQMARVARICRHEDFDYKTKRVKLWNPPT